MDWIEILSLPKSCAINMTITKVSLKQRDQITLSESRLLDGADIQSIKIIGAVNKRTANIETVESDEESYLEIYFVLVKIAAEAYNQTYKPITRLLHKHIPHHCIIITQADDKKSNHISLYTKLINQQRRDMRVLTKEVITRNIEPTAHSEFIKHLSFASAQRLNLKAFYEHYIQVVQSHLVAQVTNEFKLRSYTEAEAMMKLYEQYEEYETEINARQRELKSATQMRDRVAINTDIYELKQNIQQIIDKLQN